MSNMSNSSAAVTCAVLAPAGPNRSRVLASLCRDERTSELPTFNILSKMFYDRILRPAEVKEFEGTLKQHQLAKKLSRFPTTISYLLNNVSSCAYHL